MAFNLPPPLSTFRSLTPFPPPEKKSPPFYKRKLANTIFISVLSLSLSLPPLRYPCQLLYHFNEYLPGNGLISGAKYLFLSGVDLVCLKPTARTDRLSTWCSSKATMLSAGSWSTDEWRDGWKDGGTNGGDVKEEEMGRGWERMWVERGEENTEREKKRDEYKQ